MLLRLAWRNLGRNRRRTGLTAGAVVFATALFLASFSMATGMHEHWIEHAIRTYPGHAQVSLRGYREHRTLDYALVLPDAARAGFDGLAGADGWAPRLETFALAIADRDESLGRALLLIGVDPQREGALTGLGASLASGRFVDGDGTGAKEVVLGATLARNLGVAPGDQVILLSSDYFGSQSADRFRVVGTLSIGDARFDNGIALTRLDRLQEFLAFPQGVSHVAVFAPRSDLAGPLRPQLEALFPPGEYEVTLWPELVPDIVQMALLDDIQNSLTLAILLAVAGFGILNTILMSVFERVREFGVMRALGLRPRAIFALVVIESLLLTALGVAIGLALSLPVLLWLQGYSIPLTFAEDAAGLFGFDPVLVFLLKPQHVVAIVAVLFVIGLLAALPPALRASRGRPVDALREL